MSSSLNETLSLEHILVDLVTSEAKLDLINHRLESITNRLFGIPYSESPAESKVQDFSYVTRLNGFAERLKTLTYRLEDAVASLDINVGWEEPVNIAAKAEQPTLKPVFPAKSARIR